MSLTVAITHRFAGFALDVVFEAPPGLTVLFGPSGSGKTSVVNAVAGLLRPDTARIALNGSLLTDTAKRLFTPPHRRRIGYVFQEPRLFPHLSVRSNLTYGRWFAGRAGPDLAEVVALLGLAPLLSRQPGALSGGEMQRVAIGRALLSAPDLLLMDEALASLDAARKAEILPWLERLRDQTRVPILYVSHALSEVARLATTIVILQDGQVRRVGPAGQVLADPGAVALLGGREAGAVIAARVVAHHPDHLTELATSAGVLHLPQIAAAPGSVVRLRILAQDVMLATFRPSGISALNILPCRVSTLVAGPGPSVAVGLIAGKDRLVARITGRSALALALTPGAPCFAVLKSVALADADVGWLPVALPEPDPTVPG